ncbi:MAG: C40 family peptidase [Bacteroidetes bacterium]|nr:C40 family peptidase [Bacteroidota bacterium]
MKALRLLIFSFLFLVSCGTSKVVHTKNSTQTTKSENIRKLESHFRGSNSKTVNSIIKNSESFLGTPYRFGGNDSSGMDCSGLVCTVFSQNNVKLPRRSEDQGKQGLRVNIEKIKPGDLLFFATSGGSKVSHVGIVYDIGNDGEIKFIHASTSKGVIISSLNEKYWNKAYLYAQSIL